MMILVADHCMTQPLSVFPLLLASSKWDDLHALVEDYVVDYQHYYSEGHCSEFRPAIVPNIVMLLRDSNATVQSNGELPLVNFRNKLQLLEWSLLSMCFGKFQTAIAIPDIVILLKDTDDSIQHNGVLALVFEKCMHYIMKLSVNPKRPGTITTGGITIGIGAVT
ncbi:hypothetical protein BU17DRAFT_63223 [Hysterangium stoloniferum]|nr:hypothetical protein BU17DRAFT_63223 [Hysterangium stoloniferum]